MNTEPHADTPPAEGEWTELERTIARLRGDGGCPWDRAQTLETLKRHLVEETCELLDSIDSGSIEHHAEELGDLLLQVALQAQIRREEGRFGLRDVVRGLCAKLRRRHPHVFGDATAATPEEALERWRRAKADERRDGAPPSSAIADTLPDCLPALLRARKIQEQAARVGFDWDDIRDVWRKTREETDELDLALQEKNAEAIREEIGDLLFAVVNLSRHAQVDAESALRQATAKFVRRFRLVEARAAETGRDLRACSAAELDKLWNQVKKSSASAPPCSADDTQAG